MVEVRYIDWRSSSFKDASSVGAGTAEHKLTITECVAGRGWVGCLRFLLGGLNCFFEFSEEYSLRRVWVPARGRGLPGPPITGVCQELEDDLGGGA